jgi:hypothetical protein
MKRGGLEYWLEDPVVLGHLAVAVRLLAPIRSLVATGAGLSASAVLVAVMLRAGWPFLPGQSLQILRQLINLSRVYPVAMVTTSDASDGAARFCLEGK